MDFNALRKVMAQQDDYRAYYTDEELAETPAQRKKRMAAQRASKPVKGVCPKCGQHIGRGLYAHQKSCKG